MPITKVQLVARRNRLLDRLRVLFRPDLTTFHDDIREILRRSHSGWKDADYGAGYLYQSFRRLGLRGFRSTEARVEQMKLSAAIAGRSVLEIGCNSGFLALELAPGSESYLAFDNNPYLIELARRAQMEVGDATVEFKVATFESLSTDRRFDIVLSFANHSTWDGNMTLDLKAYFSKIQDLLVPGGMLYFESHHPALESGAQLEATLALLQEDFVIQSQTLLVGGSAWDRGRTFVVARSRRVG